MQFQATLNIIRFHRPIGSLLLLWPTFIALWLANQGIPSFKLLVIFSLGVFFMRSAGCVVNDLADQRFDGHVKRTKDRPLVTGKITRLQATVLLFMLLMMSLLLVLQTNWATIRLSFIALGFAVVYPFCKRIVYWPQAVLGCAFAMAVPMAYSASNSEFDTAGVAVFVATIFWAVAFDTLYAIVDREDDQKIGVKSTALLFGQYIHQAVISCQVIVLGLFLLVAMIKHLSSPFYLFWGCAVGSIVYQIILMQQRCEQKYFQAFLQNHWTGLFLFAAIFSSYLSGSH